MKRLTLVALATLMSASSVVAFSSSVKAETREEYCRHHDCGREYRPEYRNDRDRIRYEREHGRYEREHGRYERYERERARRERQRERYYDREAHEWRYRYP